MRIDLASGLLLCLGLVLPAVAQTTPPDQPPMIPADLNGGADTAALQPVTFQLAPSIDGDFVPPATLPSNLFHEDVFLTHRDGKLFRDANGSLLFQPEPLGQLMPGATLPALKLLPCRQLTALEPLLNDAADANVTLSGLVTAYNERNYLLVTVATKTIAATQRSDSAVLASGTTAAPTTRPKSATQPAGDLLNQMLTPTPQTARPLGTGPIQKIDQTSGDNSIAPNSKAINLLREGLYVVDRTGRLQKTAGSEDVQFVFDSDGKGMGDPPMIVLPNLKLMTMEQSLRGSGRDVKFRITGQVTEYNGRNYLLLEKVIIPPDASQQF